MDELGVWRTAQDMIDQFGGKAEAAATERADKAANDGDLQGERYWRRTLAAIRDLRRRAERRSPL